MGFYRGAGLWRIAIILSMAFTGILSKLKIDRWWSSKAGRIFNLILLALILRPVEAGQIPWLMLLSFSAILGFGLFGYFLNDLTDKEEDRLAGKSNIFEKQSPTTAALALLTALTLALAPWLYLPYDQTSMLLIGLEIAFFIFYSVKPLRLKRHFFASAVLDSFYAFAIPAALAVHTFSLAGGSVFSANFLLGLFLWSSCTGLAHILRHHQDDFRKDQITSQQTLPTVYGHKLTNKLVFFFQFINLSGWLLIGWLLYLKLNCTIALLISGLSLAFLASSLLRFFSIPSAIPGKAGAMLNANEVLFGLLLIGLLIAHLAPIFLLPTILFFAFFLVPSLLVGISGEFFRNLLSRPVNFAIYKARKFLGADERRARKMHFDPLIHHEELLPGEGSEPVIALINQNAGKFSETFVSRHREELPFRVFSLVGTPLPDTVLGLGKLTDSLPDTLRSEAQTEKKIEGFFLRKGIRLVLAEFGSMAVSVLPVCRRLGIPLICIHHGYDIHHKETLEKNLQAYREMWSYASVIIAVSREIEERIISLGAASEKTRYLPCAPNLNHFPWFEGERPKNQLLFVGRLVENKGPHLLLMAFKELLKDHPDLKLKFAGGGDQSDLSESLKQMAMAWKIEDSVEFQGVLKHEQVLEAMNNSTLLVMPSVSAPISGDKEGTPLSLMEAMASGLPVVAYNHAGIAELIRNDENGLLVDEYDLAGLVGAISKLLDNESMRKRIALEASQNIRQNELLSSHIEKLTQWINEFRLR